ncbi:hypothetical protein H8356DRAFT_1651913 [Neocallimastix lanati (nom. inval.)]|jgi:hypothetical protein|uniref:Flavin reductase like domain-containing protein n=1 Tax=Neocallimastix californiae TaxID=1754190 RepID=A0A1Y2BTJ4_9FUNG|nr:hypothetical protein H8356DRAFT_1651913 [Neocallimastix sp. JGI-2020a]ORY38078.1 hypothetical protein LY90DRAFT_672648 [Neocallimastix californiae]|eukprot:ORY38078.1 hypothetical protein LY90DRAFT_672648 [Neocallimastix californiae]
MEGFKDTRIVDNFYQTSSFIPMPTTLIGTLDDNFQTSFGAYSLVFPYYVGSRGYHAMLLECRNTSNTCKHILRRGKCTINFMPDDKKYFKNIVALGFPGDTPEEKRKLNKFTPVDGLLQSEDPEGKYPKILKEAFQVFECTWMRELDNAQDDVYREEYPGPYHSFNGITSKHGAHFILKIEKILLKEKYHNAIINGVNRYNFPPLPTNYGYRDSLHFFESQFSKPLCEDVPKKEVNLDSVKYAAHRADPDIQFTDDALMEIVGVPRIFLGLVLKGCVKWAKENNVNVITSKEMKIISEQRKKK